MTSMTTAIPGKPCFSPSLLCAKDRRNRRRLLLLHVCGRNTEELTGIAVSLQHQTFGICHMHRTMALERPGPEVSWRNDQVELSAIL